MCVLQGFLNLNKPSGFTSHDCVAKVRRLLQTRRVGHGGTLDPAATGVLPIAIGRATRLLQFLPDDKAYHATIRFGLRTTTDDLEGEILHQAAVAELSLDRIKPMLLQFQGTIQQIPPKYSAVQVGGQRLYDLARAGVKVEIPIRMVTVHQISVLGWRSGDYPELDLAIACGSGTYIRSIARDLGEMLGCGGTLSNLIRTRSSGFSLETSLTFDDLSDPIKVSRFQPIPPEQGVSHLAIATLSPELAQRWCQGQKLELSAGFCALDTPVRVQTEAGQFLGIAEAIALETSDQVRLVPKVVFN